MVSTQSSDCETGGGFRNLLAPFRYIFKRKQQTPLERIGSLEELLEVAVTTQPSEESNEPQPQRTVTFTDTLATENDDQGDNLSSGDSLVNVTSMRYEDGKEEMDHSAVVEQESETMAAMENTNENSSYNPSEAPEEKGQNLQPAYCRQVAITVSEDECSGCTITRENSNICEDSHVEDGNSSIYETTSVHSDSDDQEYDLLEEPIRDSDSVALPRKIHCLVSVSPFFKCLGWPLRFFLSKIYMHFIKMSMEHMRKNMNKHIPHIEDVPAVSEGAIDGPDGIIASCNQHVRSLTLSSLEDQDGNMIQHGNTKLQKWVNPELPFPSSLRQSCDHELNNDMLILLTNKVSKLSMEVSRQYRSIRLLRRQIIHRSCVRLLPA